MLPLSIRLGPGRFLDPLFLVIVAFAVVLYLAFREAPPRGASGRRLRVAAWAVWGSLWVLSTPVAAGVLTEWTETRGPDLGVALAGKDRSRTALVVLGSGPRTHDESLPLRERLDAGGTQRVLTASRLWQEQQFGVVILSGAPVDSALASRDLILHLGVPPERVVVEDRSVNTRENAANSAAILKERGIDTVVVVTSATHLRRSVKDFAAVGVTAIPAAADVVGGTRTTIDAFLPSALALARTHICLHEILGYVRG